MRVVQNALRVFAVALGALGLLALAIWIAWIPSAREPPYAFVSTWGERGSGPGQFDDPTGIAVAPGEVFVSDARNARIQVFDLHGRFLRQFGTREQGPGHLGRPMNLSIAGDELYIADYFLDQIVVFGLDGTPRRRLGRAGSGPGEFNAPGGVALAANGDLLVADFYNQRVQRLRPDGQFVRQWGETGTPGRWGGFFNYPTDVALGPGDAVFVADGYGDRVQVLAGDGGFLYRWGGILGLDVFGPFNGWFTTVTGIDIDPGGDVLVADFYNDRVQKFAPDGRFLTAFGGRGDGPGQFAHPIALAAAADGTLFVVDYGNNRVQKWRTGSP